MAKYICFEGTEGVGKTTQTKKLVQYLVNRGYKVLETKEPGTIHSPLTMQLRKIMLDAQFDHEMTQTAREFVSQAIRSIHLEKVIIPALNDYDFIIQDRGVLSGLAYGEACGNDLDWLLDLANTVCLPMRINSPADLYDKVVYLTGDVSKGLEKAKSSKQEFEAGDAIEAKGNLFMENVRSNMDRYSGLFNTVRVNVDGKNIEEVFAEIVSALELE
jgi:dTMP kinase